jgi:hypothetical protein
MTATTSLTTASLSTLSPRTRPRLVRAIRGALALAKSYRALVTRVMRAG